MNHGFWNVTYNDPGRWREVYGISGPRLSWREGIQATLKGFPLGSPKLDLERIEGLPELQALRDALNDRTDINFLRTEAGLIAFTKVRLEVYAIPIQNGEWHVEFIDEVANRAQIVLHVQRDGAAKQLVMAGAASTVSRMADWLERAARSVR